MASSLEHRRAYYNRPEVRARKQAYMLAYREKHRELLQLKDRQRAQERKRRAIELKGGKCVRCGYDRCIAALEFHHRDPSQKEFQIARNMWMSWDRIVVELEKCDLLCANCHNEVHFEEINNADNFYNGRGENRRGDKIKTGPKAKTLERTSSLSSSVRAEEGTRTCNEETSGGDRAA